MSLSLSILSSTHTHTHKHTQSLMKGRGSGSDGDNCVHHAHTPHTRTLLVFGSGHQGLAWTFGELTLSLFNTVRVCITEFVSLNRFNVRDGERTKCSLMTQTFCDSFVHSQKAK